MTRKKTQAINNTHISRLIRCGLKYFKILICLKHFQISWCEIFLTNLSSNIDSQFAFTDFPFSTPLSKCCYLSPCYVL